MRHGRQEWNARAFGGVYVGLIAFEPGDRFPGMAKAFGSPKYIDPAAFQTSVSQHFGAVAAEGRLFGPIADGYRVAYSSRKFSIAIAYDESDGRVETYVDARVGNQHP